MSAGVLHHAKTTGLEAKLKERPQMPFDFEGLKRYTSRTERTATIFLTNSCLPCN